MPSRTPTRLFSHLQSRAHVLGLLRRLSSSAAAPALSSGPPVKPEEPGPEDCCQVSTATLLLALCFLLASLFVAVHCLTLAAAEELVRGVRLERLLAGAARV